MTCPCEMGVAVAKMRKQALVAPAFFCWPGGDKNFREKSMKLVLKGQQRGGLGSFARGVVGKAFLCRAGCCAGSLRTSVSFPHLFPQSYQSSLILYFPTYSL